MAAINPFYNDEETEEEEDEEGGALLPEPVKVTENSVEEPASADAVVEEQPDGGAEDGDEAEDEMLELTTTNG